ncbi:hypothetical protein B0H66DRAFT_556574, partial [Apodospora peruviana]
MAYSMRTFLCLISALRFISASVMINYFIKAGGTLTLLADCSAVIPVGTGAGEISSMAGCCCCWPWVVVVVASPSRFALKLSWSAAFFFAYSSSMRAFSWLSHCLIWDLRAWNACSPCSRSASQPMVA